MTKTLIQRISKLVRDLYDDRISYEELLKQAPELNSEQELSHVLGLIEHQPAEKWFFGLDNKEAYEEHKKALFEELERLVRKYDDADSAAK